MRAHRCVSETVCRQLSLVGRRNSLQTKQSVRQSVRQLGCMLLQKSMATSPAVDPNLTLSLAPPRLRGLVGPGATPYSSVLSRSDMYSNLSCSWWCECCCCCFPVTTTLPITTRWQTLSFWLILYFELHVFLTSFLSNFLCVQARFAVYRSPTPALFA